MFTDVPCVAQEQYVFIHDAILEACLCGETAVPVNEFALAYKDMLKVDSQSNTSPLREEFQVGGVSEQEQEVDAKRLGGERIRDVDVDMKSQLKKIPFFSGRKLLCCLTAP